MKRNRRSDAELRGRIIMLEVLIGVTIARTAALMERADLFIQPVMENAETLLRERRAAAAPPEHETLDFALQAFEQMSGAMLRHLTKMAKPAGKA